MTDFFFEFFCFHACLSKGACDCGGKCVVLCDSLLSLLYCDARFAK